MIRSGDRIPTGTGAARRRLTREEAEAGGLPEPMTAEEWRAMAAASRHDHDRHVFLAVQRHSAWRLDSAQRAKVPAVPQPVPVLPKATEMNRKPFSQAELAQLSTLAAHGHTLPEIATAMGRCTKTVSRWLRAYDIRVRRTTRKDRHHG
jgi:hypothetical protein